MCEEVRSASGEIVSTWGKSLSMERDDVSVLAEVVFL
jgi:hypothetical protein